MFASIYDKQPAILFKYSEKKERIPITGSAGDLVSEVVKQQPD